MSSLKTIPINEGTTVPEHIGALARGYMEAYGEPVPTDESVGDRLPSALWEAWRHGKIGLTEAVAAWVERHEDRSWSDAPWLIEWATVEYQGRFSSPEGWASEEVGGDINWGATDYSVDLSEKVDWESVANEIEHDDEAMFLTVDPGAPWSEVWVFSGSASMIEDYRDEWHRQRQMDEVMAGIRLEATDKWGMSTYAEISEGNQQVVTAIMTVARQMGMAPLHNPFANELRAWIDRGSVEDVPTGIGVVIDGATYRLVTGQR